MAAEPALKDFRFIRYHRRGYAGSSRPMLRCRLPGRPPTASALMRTSTPCRRTSSAIPPGRSSAFSSPSTRPRRSARSHCLSLPCCSSQRRATLREARAIYPDVPGRRQGGRSRHIHAGRCGNGYRARWRRTLPGAMEQADRRRRHLLHRRVPGDREWTFTGRRRPHQAAGPFGPGREQRRSDRLPAYSEIHQHLEWFPQAKPFVLPGQPTYCRSRTRTTWRRALQLPEWLSSLMPAMFIRVDLEPAPRPTGAGEEARRGLPREHLRAGARRLARRSSRRTSTSACSASCACRRRRPAACASSSSTTRPMLER